MRPSIFFLLLVLPFLYSSNVPVQETVEDQKCDLRTYPTGRVCVCNSTYCDTLSEPSRLPVGEFYLYQSNEAGFRFHKIKGKFQKGVAGEKEARQSLSVVINRDKQFQKIYGWGGAFTDAFGINVRSLDEKAQDLLLKSYFSEHGINYTLNRVPIGGTDFSTHYYTYDDTDEPDTELKHFSLQTEDYEYKIPLIKAALELNKNQRLFGSLWGAPKWIKTNNEFFGKGFIKFEYYQAWANYFVKFLAEYSKQGIPYWAVTTQNEPLLGVIPLKPIPSVGWTSLNLTLWIKQNLGPTIKASPFPKTEIIILDDQKIFLPWYTNAILEDKNAYQYISGIAIHWYMANITPCRALTKAHMNFPDIFILSTEGCNGFQQSSGVLLGSWERGEAYSNDLIDNMECWVVGWVDWNMALDLQGGPTMIDNYVDSPIVVNASAGEFYKQPMFYHLGHHSKFVLVDSVRLEVLYEGDDDFKVVAYQRPDNGTVVVILNKKEVGIEVNIFDSVYGTATVPITKKSINTVLYWD